MKHVKNMIVALSMLGMAMASTLAMSECRTGMDAEMLVECITIEGSGANYQDWRAQYEKAMRQTGKDAAQQVHKSPTGENLVSDRR